MRIQGNGYSLSRISRHYGTDDLTHVSVAVRHVLGEEARWYAWQGPHEAPLREWHQVDGESERQFLNRVRAEARSTHPRGLAL